MQIFKKKKKQTMLEFGLNVTFYMYTSYCPGNLCRVESQLLAVLIDILL